MRYFRSTILLCCFFWNFVCAETSEAVAKLRGPVKTTLLGQAAAPTLLSSLPSSPTLAGYVSSGRLDPTPKSSVFPEPRSFATASSYRVLGIGAAAVDLLIQVDDTFFAQHDIGEKGGSRLCDFEMIDRIVQVSGRTPKIVPGGSTANTMRALAKLGETSAYFSHIGTDMLGDYYGEHLRREGVVDRLDRRSDLSTARILCLISPDGQRTFRAFDPPIHDIKLNPDHFEGVSLVHFEARQIRNGLSLQRALEHATQAGATVSLDLSCFEIVREHRESLLYLLDEYVDIVFCNEDELRELLGLSGHEGCRRLAEICPIAVVTQGAKGCLIGQGSELHSIPTFPAEVVDTTGAGDLFAAGFLYGHLRQLPLSSCARIGHRLGSAVVEVLGSELPERKWEEIRALLREEQP